MHVRTRSWSVLVCAAAALAIASSAAAQIEDQLSAYTGPNAEAYLMPLAEAIGGDLNSGLWHSAYIPQEGFYVQVETRLMAVYFGDDQKVFTPVAGEGFAPLGDLPEVPTIAGDTEAVFVAGENSTSFAYPGGLDLNSFAVAVPQVRIGGFKGTEALVRYIAIDVGDAEIGNFSLLGLGLRHSISQYMAPDFPIDLAGGFFWQNFKLGDELIDATAMTFGVQASKRFPAGFALVEPYACVSYDTFTMDVSYTTDNGDTPVDLSMETDPTARFTLGLHVQAAFLDLNGEYSFAGQNGFALGLGFVFGR
jgi:hypothetical protein